MTPSEAAKVLQLNPDASTQEIESHFLQLKSALEEKAAKALTPRLRTRYEGALAEVTTAYETLVLARDAHTLPALNLGPVVLSPRPTAKPPKPGFFTALGRQIMGMIRGAAVAGLGIIALVIYTLLTEDTGFEAPGPDFDGGFTFIMGFIAMVVLPGLFAWQASVRKANNLPTKATPYVLAIAGFALAGLSGVAAYQVRSRPAPVAASPVPVAGAEPSIEQPLSASALVAEGLDYRMGENGLVKDEAKAVELFQRAADLGSRDGMHFLATSYELGIGVTQNLELALQWHQAAADLGEPFSIQAIARVKSALAAEHTRLTDQTASIELNNRAVEFWAGQDTPKNPAKAVELWREAAAKGSREAMWGLGLAYEQGAGVGRDPATARQWFEQAASLGLEDAIERLKALPEPAAPSALAANSGQMAAQTTSADANQAPIE